MKTTNAKTFFSNLHNSSDKLSEARAIEEFTGYYHWGSPHGAQLDAARYIARVVLDSKFSELGVQQARYVLVELSAAERELLRRWRNYERRALLARNELRDLDAEHQEKAAEGEVPSVEECAKRASLVVEVEFWQRRADNPQDYPLEVDQWVEPSTLEDSTLEELISAQKADKKEWERISR